MLLANNREELSSYINRMIRELIDSFLNNYGLMKDISVNTTEAMRVLPESSCLTRMRNRWEIQVTRHGQILSKCLLLSTELLTEWNTVLNTIHSTAQRTSNQVQNSGMSILAALDEYISQTDYERLINRQLRQLLILARPYQFRFDDFTDEVKENAEQVRNELTSCDRGVTNSFRIQAAEDLMTARNCSAA